MKRFRFLVLLFSILVSLGVHSLIFLRFAGDDEVKTLPETSMYTVTLKYASRPARVQQEREERTIMRRRKQKPEKKPPREPEEPVRREENVLAPEPPVESEAPPEEEFSASAESEAPSILEKEESTSMEENGTDVPVGTQRTDDEMRYDEVIAGLRSRIIENLIYPQVARKRNIEGVVQVVLSLDEHGKEVELQILESSGSKILDRAALSLIRKVLPYEHGLGRGFSVQIPIRYDLS
jgi:protein TonB